MECKIFRNDSYYSLEYDINKFIQDKDDVRISLSTSEIGYSFYYIAIVYWEG